ncbi:MULTISPECIES: TetR/AcrR family transcriptional regulator [unclassified Nocardioides]|uniref:TetR/AcrR family transcriptional regulator n=1 Tax=unclassified Nocardioides TaxID=2615069 RepID=UPI0011500C64|nr:MULTISPECIES: TetR/AcrR family transcriptional regulator [unclassified Nocardioides]TQK72119.1 TetR family transcriptional regulator [Nocardioides sp. SLBN-35]WGY03663.1 TetR/AcrR family transcriptional regulator [Nocardioides sp. QY071]
MTATTEGLSRLERRKAETRREIIEAAFTCFAEQGYHATGIADIAARLGIGHGTFYRYFENKRDIVEHVIDDLIGRIVEALGAENAPDAVSTLEDYRAQTARIGTALAQIFSEDPRVAQLLLSAAGIDDAMRERMLDLFAMTTPLTAAYLEHGVRLGYLRADLDVEPTAQSINGMILGSVLVGMRDPAPAQQERLSAAIRAVMYDGIAAR